MVRDVVQHLPVVEENTSIEETLQQLESNSPSPKKKKKIDGSANHNKKHDIAKKEPKTKAKLLAEKCPQTKIPDSAICPENITVGSPVYIPYKKDTNG